jgi:hypothetical protein
MKHFLNDIEIAPRNISDIGIISDWTDNPDELQLNVDKLVLPREGLTIIQDHISTQGVFEGIPYKVELESGIVLEYYVDLTANPVFRSYEIEVKIKKRLGKDNFFDRASGTTFELLNAKGVQFDLIEVPYVIVKDNALELGVSLGISLYVMTKELIQASYQTAIIASQLIQAIVLNINAGGPIVPINVIVSLSVQFLAQIAYTVAVLVAVIKLGQQLFELIFPKVRYYNATKVKELIKKGCNYLGFNFESTLLDQAPGLTVLPVPLTPKEKSFFDFLQNDLNFAFNKQYPTAQDTTPTLLSLIEAIENWGNARTRVINGTVYIERRDYWQLITPNAITPALVLQDDRQDEYTLNLEEVWKRYYISYRVDYSDIYTADDFDSTDAEYSTEPTNVINADLVTIKGLNEVQIPFALGKRKNSLNFVEKVAKEFLELIDSVASFFGGGTNYSALIENRIGVLVISQQYFGTTKLLYTTGQSGKQPANYKDFIRASALWNKYHYINQIQINDYLIRETARVQISDVDFVNLLNNNYAEINGVIVEILRLEFIDARSYATITYKQPFNYADGKVETLIINE